MKIHWGEPKNVIELRCWTGAISRLNSPKWHQYITHGVVRWYGISFGRDRFLGVLVFGKTQSYSSREMPRVGFPDDWGRRPKPVDVPLPTPSLTQGANPRCLTQKPWCWSR